MVRHTETVLMLEVRDVVGLLSSNTLTDHTGRVSTINQLSCFLPVTSGDVTAELGLALLCCLMSAG